uniref:Uncharacterized protein n=1 Tax=Anguilla anguilla TaxID=7936 RepID=A0A0E9RZG2_ANGAN
MTSFRVANLEVSSAMVPWPFFFNPCRVLDFCRKLGRRLT